MIDAQIGAMMPFDLSIYGTRILFNAQYEGISTCLYDFSTKEWFAYRHSSSVMLNLLSSTVTK